MRDLIDRQAALNEAYTVFIEGEPFRVVQVETLEGLPSAEATMEEVRRYCHKRSLCLITSELYLMLLKCYDAYKEDFNHEGHR